MKPPPKRSAELGEARTHQDAIGAGLRRMFEEVIKEPVPDEFLDLLRQADERRKDPENDPDGRR